MENCKYMKNVQNNNTLLQSYFDYTQSVFGFDLMKWKEEGYLDNKYIVHSIVLDEKVIAGLGAAHMKVQINGKEIPAIEIGSVGVLEEYRGKGIARELMERVLDDYKNYPLIFLFASDDVSEFYLKFGFKRFDESYPFINISNNSVVSKPKKLAIESPIIERLLNSKLQHSSIIDARNNQSIYWFHLIYIYSDDIYYIEEKDIIFIATYSEDEVHLYDVLSKNKVTFEEIKRYIIKENTKKVWFHFTPDWLNVDYDTEHNEENALYIRGEFLEDMSNYKFPKTSVT